MTTTIVMGMIFLVLIILGFLVATALLVEHPDIEPVKRIDDDYDIPKKEDLYWDYYYIFNDDDESLMDMYE